MIGYISIGSYRIKGDDWQSHPLREVVSTVPLYELAFLRVSPEQLSDYNVASCAIFDVYCENVKMCDL